MADGAEVVVEPLPGHNSHADFVVVLLASNSPRLLGKGDDDSSTESEDAAPGEEEAAVEEEAADKDAPSPEKSQNVSSKKNVESYTQETQDRTWKWYDIKRDDPFIVKAAQIR